MANKSILVTGASGYIGQSLITKLKAHDPNHKITAVDLQEGDIRDRENWLKWVPGHDVIYHLATQTSHYVANENPEADWQISVKPLLYLLDACQKTKTRARVVFTSSATVYGLTDRFPVEEERAPDPLSVYDIHKLACEAYLKFYSNLNVVTSVALRLANVYGPSSGRSKQDRGVINQMIKKALSGESAFTVYGEGKWIRDYIHLNDVVDALILVGEKDDALVSGRNFNVCSGKGTRFVDVVGKIQDYMTRKYGKKVGLTHLNDKKLLPIDERSFVGDNSALTNLGWSPRVSLDEGLQDLVDVTKRQLDGE